MPPDSLTVEARDALLRWWDAYPSVKSLVECININGLASLIRDVNPNKSDYSVIDVVMQLVLFA